MDVEWNNPGTTSTVYPYDTTAPEHYCVTYVDDQRPEPWVDPEAVKQPNYTKLIEYKYLVQKEYKEPIYRIVLKRYDLIRGPPEVPNTPRRCPLHIVVYRVLCAEFVAHIDRPCSLRRVSLSLGRFCNRLQKRNSSKSP